jgi:hypothetical protein
MAVPAVGELVGGEADLDRLEAGQTFHDLARRHALYVLAVLGGDMSPVLRGAVLHVGEHTGSSSSLSDLA